MRPEIVERLGFSCLFGVVVVVLRDFVYWGFFFFRRGEGEGLAPLSNSDFLVACSLGMIFF